MKLAMTLNGRLVRRREATVALGADGWRVIFRGERQVPRWLDKGPALAYARALDAGTRKPEPEKEKKA